MSSSNVSDSYATSDPRLGSPIRRPARKRRGRGKGGLTRGQRAEIKSLVERDVEEKYLVTAGAGSITSTTAISSLADIPQGIADTQRVGDTVTLHDLELKFNVAKVATNTALENYVRVAVIQWHPTSALVAPTASALFLLDPSLATISFRSFWTHDYKPNFTVLFDQVVKLAGPGSATTGNSSTCHFTDVMIPIPRKIIQFAAATVDGSNKLYLVTISSEGANAPTLTSAAQLHYRDG
jgi:hypothetical protein